MINIVYFSTTSETTHRFVNKLDKAFNKVRIPEKLNEEITIDEPYILITPTYGGGTMKGAVPRQVISFLNNPDNRKNIKGVISSGNTNFGSFFAMAGVVIAEKCKVPLLYKFELLGTEEDVIKVNDGVNKFWKTINP